jgi:hypothetical protein
MSQVRGKAPHIAFSVSRLGRLMVFEILISFLCRAWRRARASLSWCSGAVRSGSAASFGIEFARHPLASAIQARGDRRFGCAEGSRRRERIATVDPGVRVRDTHPLSVHDPNGLNIFYLMLVTTIVGFLTVFQVRANARQLPRRHQIAFVVGLALTASLVLTLVDGPLLNRLTLPVPETWGILALQLLAAASFTSLMVVLIGRWAILPTFLFVVVLGNASSGGAVSSPLLPPAFAFFSQWHPSGATVTALRDAIYFAHHQQARPIVVLATWAILLFAAWLWVSRRREASVTQAEKEPLPRTVAAP